jgi:CheY-like chemotaxis protein
MLNLAPAGTVDTTEALPVKISKYIDYYMSLLAAPRNKTVLIVEDDPDSRLILEEIVKFYDPEIKCWWATSEEEGARLLKDKQCDLVLADYFLEGPNTGLDLCHKVKAFYPDTQCAVISGLEKEEFEKICGRETTRPFFFQKPISSAQITTYLNDVFGD